MSSRALPALCAAALCSAGSLAALTGCGVVALGDILLDSTDTTTPDPPDDPPPARDAGGPGVDAGDPDDDGGGDADAGDIENAPWAMLGQPCRRLIHIGWYGTETLIEFPMLLDLAWNDLSCEGRAPNVSAFRFADEDGTLLAHDTERALPGDNVLVWVNVPSIVPSDDHLWVYFGAQDGNEVSTDVWPEPFRGVWHMAAENSSAQQPDSTANEAHAIKEPDGSGPTLAAAGALGPAAVFDADLSQRLRVPDDGSVHDAVSSGWTFSAWVYTDVGESSGNADTPLWKGGTASAGYALQTGGGEWRALLKSDTVTESLGFGDAANWQGLWHLIGVSLGGGWLRVYVDGELENEVQTGITSLTSAADLMFGSRDNGTADLFNGQIDEVRVEATARSEDWHYAMYLQNGGGFYTVDDAQPRDAP